MKQRSVIGLASLALSCGGEPKSATAPSAKRPPAAASASAVPLSASAPASTAAQSSSTSAAAAQLGGGGFPTPPPWPPVWCVNGEGFWDAQLQAKHFPDRPVMSPPNPRYCGWEVRGAWGAKQLSAGVQCGTGAATLLTSLRSKAALLSGYESPVYLNRYPDGVSASSWTTDPPCYISVGANKIPPAQAEARVLALMQDLLVRVTSAAVSRPMAQLVVAASDKTGELARRALAAYPARKVALDAVAPLAAGFPRVARSDDFPGLPKGEQFLLLGVCPSGQGDELAQLAPLIVPNTTPNKLEPPEEFAVPFPYVVDATGLSANCASGLEGPALSRRQSSGGEWALSNGRTLSIGYWGKKDPAPGGPLARVALVLYDANGKTLDVMSFAESAPPELKNVKGPFAPQANRKLGECEMRPGSPDEGKFFLWSCDVFWSDTTCPGKPDRVLKTINFEVTDDNHIQRARVSEQLVHGPGCGAKSEQPTKR